MQIMIHESERKHKRLISSAQFLPPRNHCILKRVESLAKRRKIAKLTIMYKIRYNVVPQHIVVIFLTFIEKIPLVTVLVMKTITCIYLLESITI